MAVTWDIEIRGGAFDGHVTFDVADVGEPGEILVAWLCGPTCPHGHFTFDPSCPVIEMRTATAYRRTELDAIARSATYDLGDEAPGDDARREEAVPAGPGVALPA